MMAKIPEKKELLVQAAIEDREIKSDLRAYLGMSILGKDCPRELWYSFRICAQEIIKPRQKRLFARGHNEEPIIIADMMAADLHVHSDQLECVDETGHIKGHIDGIAENVPDAPKTPHLLEMKTANDKNFKELVKQGLEKKFPVYYAQMILYMHKLKLKRGLFVATNKNDDSRYYERVYPNNQKAKELLVRGVDIISSEVPPAKIGSATHYKCKWCKYYDICHFNGAVLKTCRSCSYCDLCNDGVWSCSRYSNLQLAFEQQLLACDNYDLMESLR